MGEDCDCLAEVARLHQFFEDWFHGKLPESDFAVCEASLGSGFTIVTPGGELSSRKDILEAIRRHRGGEPADFTIETVGRHCQRIGELHLTSYEERQTGTRATSRLSSAVLSETVQGFVWHSVHETWITS
jgi:hypothetical protein